MPSTAQSTQPAAWPEGVVARYLTKAAEISGMSITVDLAETDDGITSSCNGCFATYHSSFDPMYEGRRMEEYADRQARAWAQTHAEDCRALPRPTA